MAGQDRGNLRVMVHVVDGEPFIADMQKMPGSMDTFVEFSNILTRDGRPPAWLSQGIHTIVYSASQITFIEVQETMKPDIFVKN